MGAFQFIVKRVEAEEIKAIQKTRNAFKYKQ